MTEKTDKTIHNLSLLKPVDTKITNIEEKECVSASKLKTLFNYGVWGFLKSYVLGERVKVKPAMQKGSQSHEVFYKILSILKSYNKNGSLISQDIITKVLGLEFEKNFIQKPKGLRKTVDKEAFEKEAKGKIILTEELLETYNSSVLFLSSISLKDLELLIYSDIEKKLITSGVGVKFLGIYDLLNFNENHGFDIKTSSVSGDPKNSALKYKGQDYFIQEMLYRMIYKQVTGKDLEDFRFIMIETSFPFKVYFMELDFPLAAPEYSQFMEKLINNYSFILNKLKEFTNDPFNVFCKRDRNEGVDLIKKTRLLEESMGKTFKVKPFMKWI